jgi:hypothetical protein
MKAIRLSFQTSNRLFRVQRFSSNLQSNKDWILFPREQEGNIYAHNWSLVNDGLTPLNSAFRNARTDLLATKLPTKVVNGKIEINSIAFAGSFALKEAGDSIPQDDFVALLQDCQASLGARPDIFVEDAAVIASHGSRIGVRVVTDNPGLAIVVRSLLVCYDHLLVVLSASFDLMMLLYLKIQIPPVEVVPLARFDGWKYDQRYSHSEYVETNWNGSNYTISYKPLEGGKGQRPIVAYIGGAGSDVHSQFIEMNGKIVGRSTVLLLLALLYYNMYENRSEYCDWFFSSGISHRRWNWRGGLCRVE